MDSIEKYSVGKNDFELDVAMVDIDHEQELEMLVFLNNPSGQGTWDKELLAEINIESGVTFEAMGFDSLDVDLLFDGDARFLELFADIPEVSEAKDALKEIKANRAESTQTMKEDQALNWFFVVVCKDKSEKDRLLKKMKIPVHEKYVSAEVVISSMESKKGD